MVTIKVDIPDEIQNYFTNHGKSMRYDDFVNRVLLLEQDLKNSSQVQNQVQVPIIPKEPTTLSEDIINL